MQRRSTLPRSRGASSLSASAGRRKQSASNALRGGTSTSFRCVLCWAGRSRNPTRCAAPPPRSCCLTACGCVSSAGTRQWSAAPSCWGIAGTSSSASRRGGSGGSTPPRSTPGSCLPSRRRSVRLRGRTCLRSQTPSGCGRLDASGMASESAKPRPRSRRWPRLRAWAAGLPTQAGGVVAWCRPTAPGVPEPSMGR